MSENKQNNQETHAEEPEMEKVTDNEAEEQATVEAQEKDPVEELRIELAELKDKYIRLYADFENFRRRTAKEKLELIANANADLMRSILPVVDDFERAKQSFETTTEVEPLKEGVDLIHNKLYKMLESKGLKPMDAKGQPFDAELHESVTQFPAPTEDLKGKVVDEIEKGYYLNDKVLRYAKVVIGA
ncbi:nucleotide exchange factor GrpE [Telluribacter humicola]|uniref:nucleotide exchange factor GrpE n=1 Tax=Telluribacter humicola TaxID=1720261 RepID=UPI001A96CF4B|nr:nucleotide exchange factor GrpE [Telluribacter humicola]